MPSTSALRITVTLDEDRCALVRPRGRLDVTSYPQLRDALL